MFINNRHFDMTRFVSDEQKRVISEAVPAVVLMAIIGTAVLQSGQRLRNREYRRHWLHQRNTFCAVVRRTTA